MRKKEGANSPPPLGRREARKPPPRSARCWERRQAARFTRLAAAGHYNVDTIEVRLITEERRSIAFLQDLSVKGAGLLSRKAQPLELPVAVELLVGDYVVEAFGFVRTCIKQGDWYRVGVQFTQLAPPDAAFLQELNRLRGR